MVECRHLDIERVQRRRGFVRRSEMVLHKLQCSCSQKNEMDLDSYIESLLRSRNGLGLKKVAFLGKDCVPHQGLARED